MVTTAYPLDITGVSASNLISDEAQVIVANPATTQPNAVVLKAAPFFEQSIQIYTQPNKQGTKLIKGVDYLLTLKFVTGTEVYGKPIFGGVLFLNTTYAGTVYVTYQTLGGDFVLADLTAFSDIVNKYYSDVRYTTWDQIEGVPSSLPPSTHMHTVQSTDTFKDLIDAVNALATNLLAGDSSTTAGLTDAATLLIRSHLANTTNAHTPSAVGLGNVPNYSLANEDDALNNSPYTFASPYIVSFLLSRYVNSLGIDQIATNITTLQTAVQTINNALNNLNGENTAFNTALSNTNTNVNDYRSEVRNLLLTLQDVRNSVDSANTVSASALTQVASAITNMSNIATQVNNVLYANTVVYPAGTHLVQLPAGQAMRFELVGGGGGSGKYYNTVADGLVNAGGPTKGQATTLRFLGSFNTPIEPVPLLSAGGGLAGSNTYGTIGRVSGGNGGTCVRYKGARVNVSSITSVNLSTDLIAGTTAETGVSGTSGDTSSAGSAVAGVGGYQLSITPDAYHLTYGQGRKGTSKAGLGGAGGRAVIVVNNDTADTVRLSLQVGSGGQVARASVNDDFLSLVESQTSDGVAAITIVN